MLNAPGAGPWMGPVLSKVIEWQLEHADGTKAECEKWLQDEQTSGRIKIDTTSGARSEQSKRGKAGAQSQSKKRVKTDPDNV